MRARVIFSMVLPRQLINEIDLRDLGFECFGIGQMIACLHAVGSLQVVRDAFKR